MVSASREQSQGTGVQGMESWIPSGPCRAGGVARSLKGSKEVWGRVSQGPVTDGERHLLG